MPSGEADEVQTERYYQTKISTANCVLESYVKNYVEVKYLIATMLICMMEEFMTLAIPGARPRMLTLFMNQLGSK
jgi:hypothetical protein